MVLLTAKLQTHICMATNLRREESICNGADANSEETLGRTPAPLTRDAEFLDRMLTTLGGTWNLVVWLS